MNEAEYLALASEFWGCLCFFATAELNIRADALLAEADRVRARNPPWARNLERKAARMRERAARLAGDRTPIYGDPT